MGAARLLQNSPLDTSMAMAPSKIDESNEQGKRKQISPRESNMMCVMCEELCHMSPEMAELVGKIMTFCYQTPPKDTGKH